MQRGKACFVVIWKHTEFFNVCQENESQINTQTWGSFWKGEAPNSRDFSSSPDNPAEERRTARRQRHVGVAFGFLTQTGPTSRGYVRSGRLRHAKAR